EGLPLDADPVTAVQALPCGGLFLAQAFDAEIALDRSVDIPDLEENRFAHVAQGTDAAGDLHLLAFGEIGAQLTRGGGGLETRAVRIHPKLPQLRELFAPHGD